MKKVLKFGGTSMGSVESLTNIAQIIKGNIKKGITQAVVCSAVGGVTDLLLKIKPLSESGQLNEALKILESVRALYFEIAIHFDVEKVFDENTDGLWEDLRTFTRGVCMIKEFSERSHAYLLSFGERLSTRLLTEILKNQGVAAVQFDSTFIKTINGDFIEAEVDWESTKAGVRKTLNPVFEKKEIPIITGFFGANTQNIISLMGRGASDLTGAIITVSLGIDTLEIWTDVDGFLSADPRIVDNAGIIPEIGYEEIAELCFFGAKVLHPKTIRPVIEAGGNVYILNTFIPEGTGTKIVKADPLSCPAVQAITSKKVAILLFDVFASAKSKREIFYEFFSIVAKKDICIDAVASSEASISICIEEKFLEQKAFSKALKEIAPLEILKEKEIICIVGSKDVKGKVGVATSFFEAISGAGVNIEMYSQSASEITQLVVVKAEEKQKAILAVHESMMKYQCWEKP